MLVYEYFILFKYLQYFNTLAVRFLELYFNTLAVWFLEVSLIRGHFSTAPSVSYEVIATDYVSYACTYSCMNVYTVRVEMFWVLTRSKELTGAAKEACLEAFESAAIDISKLEPAVQSRSLCFPSTSSDDSSDESSSDDSHPSEGSIEDGYENLEEKVSVAKESKYFHNNDAPNKNLENEQLNIEIIENQVFLLYPGKIRIFLLFYFPLK